MIVNETAKCHKWRVTRVVNRTELTAQIKLNSQTDIETIVKKF